MNMKFECVIAEIKKYNQNVHILNDGASKEKILQFEKKFGIILPDIFKEWLELHNGGEFFALPVGTNIAGILGDTRREKGIFYLEDNFDIKKRKDILESIFVIGELCDGEIVGFDLENSTVKDGVILQYDVESNKIVDKWDGFIEWLSSVFEEGTELFDYEGNDR